MARSDLPNDADEPRYRQLDRVPTSGAHRQPTSPEDYTCQARDDQECLHEHGVSKDRPFLSAVLDTCTILVLQAKYSCIHYPHLKKLQKTDHLGSDLLSEQIILWDLRKHRTGGWH